jgi:hypothetical protein
MRVKLAFRLPDGKTLSAQVDKNTFTIGRSSKVDVVVPFEGLSREHCVVMVKDESVIIQDLGSPNGILVNDERITSKGSIDYNPVLDSLSLGGVDVTQFTILLNEDVLDLELKDNLEMGPRTPSMAAPRAEKSTIRNVPRSKDVVQAEDKSQLHPSVRAMVILLALGAVFLLYHQITSDPEDNFLQQQFEANLKKKEKDGTIKTSNF